MELGLKDKRAFVAGSSDGIGRAIAEGLASEGCNVMLCARSEDKLARLADELQKTHNVRASYVCADLDSSEDIAAAITAMKEQFGGCDILVTNNGGPNPGDFRSMSEDDWIAGWNRTLMSGVRLIRGFLDGMIEQQWGRVINVTSISVKQPVQRLLLSNTYRAGVTGMAKTLSDEVCRHGVTVNNVAPGYIQTGRQKQLFTDRAEKAGTTPDAIRDQIVANIPMGRIGSPDEIAHMAVFLASERASYLTGATIQVDGGIFRGLM